MIKIYKSTMKILYIGYKYANRSTPIIYDMPQP